MTAHRPSPAGTGDPQGAESPAHVGVPSIHLRAVATWLAIFPLVSLGLFALEAVASGLHPLVQVLVLTLVVVPLAVYLVVPFNIRVLVSVARRVAAWSAR